MLPAFTRATHDAAATVLTAVAKYAFKLAQHST